ncbi:disease resistance protein L6 isoform X3 [Lactuca sativa]|nr:disease resistance protein L6 isoform X3 [Lactuca sativa]
MEVISAIISPIVESLIDPVKKQLGYLFSSTKHVRNMNTKIKLLDDTSCDVKKHMETNNISNLETPTHVPGWLEEVEETKEKAQSIPSTGSGCCNLKMRYRAGRNAFKITQEMERLIDENSKITWSDTQRPLGKVNSKIASSHVPSDGDAQNHFKSREKSFKNALESLQQDHKSKVIALCGMGGVGKTTMMEQLKKAAEDKKMFDYVVKVVIGQQINMSKIQQDVAVYMMGQSLTEPSKEARADRLRITFGNLPEGRRRVLLILDDVWETIELKDIGLSPLPNGFKLLLTSRNENIYKQIAVEANSDSTLVRVDVMEEPEAQNFFWKITGVSKQHDMELNQIGSEIVRRCGFLPLAIKLIAKTLQFQEVFLWRDTFQRLKKKNLDENVQEVIKISYDYIKTEEEKVIFLLCGLFPDDFNIPIEELTRYAWGLRLLSEVSTLGEARDRTKTCVQNLRNANLLMDSDYIGCVKMHDLVLAFVLSRVSKGDHPWMINHGDISKWSRAEVKDSCKRVSITCTGMSEFAGDFKYPNLSLLRLMDGDKSLKFPEDFYKRMENLEVVAYEKMQYPLLPRSLECSTKLRTLILHQCLLMFDCSVIGELLNLEVLSFAHCGIRKLPSTIGKLKKLKLLDLTGCLNLRIDDGVLINLVELEELYMRVDDRKAIRFTNGNRAELAELSKHLSALELEFFDNNGTPENMLFTKLKRFRISMGCGLVGNTHKNMHLFENTLRLVTNKDELLESGMNELFEKTEVLYLEVDGINDLEEVLVESVHLPRQAFNNLRVLDVFNCENLRYLFTVPIANGLMKLERLTVSKCPALEVLAHSENGGDGAIKFQRLKFLRLDRLPKLIGLCNNANVIELPQLVELELDGLPNFSSIYPEKTSATSSMSSNASAIQPFFNKQMLIPKLEKLRIWRMDKLKEIWPYQFISSKDVDACMLRKIEVGRCDNLVNLFPTNPMSLLGRLEELDVRECESIELLFNIDMSCVGETEEYSSSLREIKVSKLEKLRELWRMKGESSSDILIRCFQAVERIYIFGCERFVNVFTPTVTNSDVRTVMKVSIDGRRTWEETRGNIELVQNNQEINVISKEEIISEVYGNIPDVESSIHPKPFHVNHLQRLDVRDCKDVEVVFEIESSGNNTDFTTTLHKYNHQPPPLLLPHLKELHLEDMERMSDVWKFNWKKLVIPQNQSQSYSFHNLTTIYMEKCHSIKYLFSPVMGKLLPNLKCVWIYDCDGIEEVVSNRDINDENEEIISSTHTNTFSSFPLLEQLYLEDLPSLKSIDGGTRITTTSIHDQFKCCQVGVASWFLCQYSKKIDIRNCPALSRVFPSNVVGQLNKLEVLRIEECKSMVEIFESKEINKDGVDSTTNVGDGSDDTCTAITLPRSANMTLLQLPNLTILKIYDCEVLEYIFTSSTLESLKQIKELTVAECKAMQVIVKEDTEHTEKSKSIIVFPCLKSLTLTNLPDLKGFFLGKNEFRWKALEKVKIYGCPQMMNFTSGHSMTPKLNYIHAELGKHSLDQYGLNFHLTNATHEDEQTQHPMCSTPDMIKLLQFPWSFSNLVEVDAQWIDKLLDSRIIFPCNELLNLKNLEKLSITNVYKSVIEEVFEEAEGTNEDVDIGTQSVVVFEKLKEVTLGRLNNLKHMWKSNRWIVLNFPNLTKVSIVSCKLLGHVFSSCMVGSLLQLQELQISKCESMDVIVKQVEDSETRPTTTEVVFPCLKSITLFKLPNLMGFCLGKEAFEWPSLDTLKIKDCPKITVFTNGQSTTPKLKLIDTTFGLCHVIEDPNSFIKTYQQEGVLEEHLNSHMQFGSF